MNPEEDKVKVLFEYMRSIQENVDRLLSDKNDDSRELLDHYSDLMLAITKLSTEVHLLVEEVRKNTKTVSREMTQTQDRVDENISKLEENLEGKTRIIFKEGKKRWWQFFSKKKKTRYEN